MRNCLSHSSLRLEGLSEILCEPPLASYTVEMEALVLHAVSTVRPCLCDKPLLDTGIMVAHQIRRAFHPSCLLLESFLCASAQVILHDALDTSQELKRVSTSLRKFHSQATKQFCLAVTAQRKTSS